MRERALILVNAERLTTLNGDDHKATLYLPVYDSIVTCTS